MEKEYELPRKFAEQWLADLRSGKYGQNKGHLFDGENSFCCLGLAVISCGNTVDILNTVLYKIDGYSFTKGDSDFIYRSDIVNNNYYVTQKDVPNYPNELLYDRFKHELPQKLADMNDKGSTFEEIANWIEENCEFYD